MPITLRKVAIVKSPIDARHGKKFMKDMFTKVLMLPCIAFLPELSRGN